MKTSAGHFAAWTLGVSAVAFVIGATLGDANPAALLSAVVALAVASAFLFVRFEL